MKKQNTGKKSRRETWEETNAVVQRALPQVSRVLSAEDDFISVLVKLQPDNTCLAVLKAYGSDGAPMVCFGSGYGFMGALFGLEGTIAANKWRKDKPWQP